MHRNSIVPHLCNLTILACGLGSIGAQGQRPVPPPTPSTPPATAALQKAQQIYSGLPLLFEANHGQANPQVRFIARTQGYTLFLTGQEAVILNNGGAKRTPEVRMRWLGASGSPVVSGEAEIAGKSNYLIGNDPSQWHSSVPNYARVAYKSLYPGVDAVYYGDHQQLEYDLTVAPGADPGAIRMRFDGPSHLRIEKKTGDLVVRYGGHEVRFRKPAVYQAHGAERQAVSGGYVLAARNTVSFALGAYDHGRPLVIDPYIVYSTIFGGTTPSEGGNTVITGMAVDSGGFVYLQGETITTDLPTTSGAYQPACNKFSPSQCSNFFVAKFDTTMSGATSLVYATYIGGTETKVSEGIGSAYYLPNDLAVDANGDAYFSGVSSTTNYPTTANAYDTTCAATVGPVCYDGGVLTKLDPTGSQLLYSTYIATATNSYAVYPGMIALDGSQVAYIAGVAGDGLPTTDGSSCPSCYQAPFAAAFDTTKSGSASLVYAVYLPMQIEALAADSSGNAYLGGLSQGTSQTYPPANQTLVPNGFQTTTSNSVGIGPYLVRLDHSGMATYATYIGSGTGPGYGLGIMGVSADANGVAYAGGQVFTPLTQMNGLAATSAFTGYGAFVAKVDTTQTGSASLLYSTFLSTTSTQTSQIYSVADNGAGQIAFAGLGSDVGSVLTGFGVNPITQPVSQPTNATFVGVIDTTQTGDSALTFLSQIDGVLNPYFIAYDPSQNLIVGGNADHGSVGDPFLSVSASYSTGAGTLTNPPFFYKLSLASPSTLTVGTTLLSFADQVTSTTSSSQPVTVSNTGTAAITFTSIVASGPFGETDNCSPSLAPSTSCTIDVTFTPTEAGKAAGGLTLTDSDGSSPQSVGLSGIGVAGAPEAVLTPTPTPFGNQAVNTTSASQTLVLSNPGTASLSITSVSITGANPGDFGDSSGCGTTLAAGATCNITVTFTPISAATFSATLSVADNAAGSPHTAALTGTGTPVPAPAAALTPTSLAFPGQLANSTSAAQSVMLTNSGTAALAISGIAASGDFAETNTCGASVAADASCVISVTFTPTATGARSGALSIADNAASSPQSVGLSGTGTAGTPQAVLTPNPVPFGNQTVNTSSPVHTVVLSNPGTASLSIASVGITGANPGDFADSSGCGTTLAAGATCNITVNFMPISAATFSATLSVADNAAGSPRTVALTGTGTPVPAPAAVLTPTSLAFPSQLANSTSAAQSVMLTNSGTAALAISSIAASGDFGATSACGASVAAGASCVIAVTFTPSAGGARAGMLTVTDNASGSPETVALNGTGADLSIAAASGSSTSATVAAGSSATYQLAFTPEDGLAATAALACTGAPAAAACTLSPGSINLSGTAPVPVTVTVTTTARALAVPPGSRPVPPGRELEWAALAMLLLLLVASAAGERRRRWLTTAGAFGLLSLMVACGGGGSSPATTPTVTGTPAGTYTLTVSATLATGAVRSTTLTFIVN